MSDHTMGVVINGCQEINDDGDTQTRRVEVVELYRDDGIGPAHLDLCVYRSEENASTSLLIPLDALYAAIAFVDADLSPAQSNEEEPNE